MAVETLSDVGREATNVLSTAFTSINTTTSMMPFFVIGGIVLIVFMGVNWGYKRIRVTNIIGWGIGLFVFLSMFNSLPKMLEPTLPRNDGYVDFITIQQNSTFINNITYNTSISKKNYTKENIFKDDLSTDLDLGDV